MPRTATRVQKEVRIDIRTTSEQKALIIRGASASGQNLSDFILFSAQKKAEIILADQKEFILPTERWNKFVSALEKTATKQERLTRLMSGISVLKQ